MIIAGIMDEEPQVYADIDRKIHKNAFDVLGRGIQMKKKKYKRVSSAERERQRRLAEKVFRDRARIKAQKAAKQAAEKAKALKAGSDLKPTVKNTTSNTTKPAAVNLMTAKRAEKQAKK